MKIIDLLIKIANGEEVPEKIRYKKKEYIYHNDLKQYYDGEDTYEVNRLTYRLSDGKMFNDIVEILEEDEKIELLNENMFHNNQKVLARKINEIINWANERENKNEN